MTFFGMERDKTAKNKLTIVGAINYTSAMLCKEISLSANQFLSHSGIHMAEWRRVNSGCYGIAGFDSGTAMKMHVMGGSCTAEKALCI